MKTSFRWMLFLVGAGSVLYSGRVLLELLGIQKSLHEEEGFVIRALGTEAPLWGYSAAHITLFLVGVWLIVRAMLARKEEGSNSRHSQRR